MRSLNQMLAHEFCTILLKILTYAVKLQGMTLTAALRAIGRLEAQYEKTDAKPVVGKSKAPAPINPIRSAANGRDVNLTSDGQFHGSYQAWRAARLAGKIR
jgi:hypothetical protein